jgi:hypothetical protein
MEEAMSSLELWMYSDMHVLAQMRSARPPAIADVNGITLPTKPALNRRDSDDSRFRNVGWSRSLNGAFAIIAICGTAAFLLWGAGTNRPIAATTIQLERLAARVERARSIHPDIARKVARMLALPEYDCARTACSVALQARNSAAHGRLATLIAMKPRPDTFAGSSDHVIATSSAQVIEPR